MPDLCPLAFAVRSGALARIHRVEAHCTQRAGTKWRKWNGVELYYENPCVSLSGLASPFCEAGAKKRRAT